MGWGVFRAVEIDDAPAIFRELRVRATGHGAFAAWCFMVLTASRPSEALRAQEDRGLALDALKQHYGF
jgi:hypothetical protein